MAEIFTEVRYEVSQAEKDLQKLDKQVVKSGKTAERSFGQVGTAGVRKFGDAIDVINPKVIALGIGLTKVGRGFRKIAKFAIQSSLIIGGLVVISKVIGATVANVANLADKLADIDARIIAINETAERTLRLRNLASSIGDANDNRRFIELKRVLDLREAESVFREDELSETKTQADELVAIRTSQFDRIDAIQRRQTAEERLRSKLAESVIVGSEFAGQTKAGQVGLLAGKAETQAQAGNIEAAEALISKARELSGELGNHVFFTKQIESAQGAVIRALEKDVKVASTKEGQLAKERIQLKGRVTDAEKFVEVLQRELDLITRQNKAFGAQRTLIENTTQQLQDVQQQKRGQFQFEAGVQQIGGISGAIGGQAFIGQIRETLGNISTAFKEAGKAARIKEARQGVELIGGAISRALDAAFKDGGVTPREVQRIIETTAGVSEALAVLEKGIADNSLSKVLETDVNRLKSLFQGLENLGRGAEQFSAGGGGFDAPINTVTTGTAQRRVDRVIERREISQEINVNIEGGLIDEATIEQITDIIARQVRKEVQRVNE